MLVIKCSDAQQQGLKYYFTGKPCKNGNYANRRVTGRQCQCDTCVSDRYKKHNQYKKENANTLKEYQKLYRNDNKEQLQQYHVEYRKNNPHKRATSRKSRKMAMTQRVFHTHQELTDFVYEEAYLTAKERTTQFGFEWHIDHIIPLFGSNVSGLHVAWNFQVIPSYLNLYKGNRMKYTNELEWLSDCT